MILTIVRWEFSAGQRLGAKLILKIILEFSIQGLGITLLAVKYLQVDLLPLSFCYWLMYCNGGATCWRRGSAYFCDFATLDINSSLKFSARMTSFRNIRFNWHGTYWKTMWFLVISPLVGLFTLGLLTPLISRYYYSYFASSHSYGTTSFSSTPKIGQFYFAFLIGAIIPTIALGCAAFTILTITAGFSDVGMFGNSTIWVVMPLLFYALLFSVVFIYAC